MATTTITISGRVGVTDYTGQFLNSSNANVGSSFNIPATDSAGDFGVVATIPATATQINVSSVTTGLNQKQPVIDDAAAGAGGINIAPGISL
jgi:hypothetical protein